MRHFSLFLLVAVLFIAAPANAEEYIIGEGDTLFVHIWGENDLNRQVLVRPDGMISMPGINDVQAAGFTISQLRGEVEKRLKRLIKDPIVNISLQQSMNSRVYVVGGGVEPTVYEMSQRTTLLHVLASVGSLAGADLEKAYVYRDGKKVMSDFSGLFKRGDFKKDIQLKPGDTVFLPVKYDRNVFVIGAVNQPQAIPFIEGLTVLDALLQAGDFSKYADEDEISIVRTEGDNQQVIKVKTKALLEKGDFKQNVQLHAGDYIVAKESFF